MNRRILPTAVVALVAATVAAVAQQGASPGPPSPLETQVFRLSWRSLDDASVLVQPLTSDDARIQIEPRLRTLTITDWPSNLRQVADALSSFDVPPRAVDVWLMLVRATQAAAPRPIGEELRSIKDSVDRIAEYSDYQVLAEARLSGVEGGLVSTVLGKDDAYRVSFRIGAADDRHGVVRFDDLALDRSRGARAGKPVFANLLTLTYHAQSGRKVVLGATRASDRETGVLLVIEATIRPEPRVEDAIAGGSN